jgi:hypothetical protein
MTVQSATQSRINKVVKALRLIRLVRIIKLYKYISQSKKANPEEEAAAKKKAMRNSQNDTDTKTDDENEQQTNFMKEADPSKLGKALSDTTTRRVIIGVLLMLMILPLLTYSENDYSKEYSVRELFWFGRSSCVPSKDPDHINFYCPEKPWITTEGWYEFLRGFLKASIQSDDDSIIRPLLWLYVPDFTK